MEAAFPPSLFAAGVVALALTSACGRSSQDDTQGHDSGTDAATDARVSVDDSSAPDGPTQGRLDAGTDAPSIGIEASAAEGGGLRPPVACTVTISPPTAIDTAFDALTPGQTLCLQSGHYGSSSTNIHVANSGASGAPLTLTTAPGQSPATIEGGFQVGVNDESGHVSYVAVSYLVFDLDYGPAGQSSRVNGTSAGCSQYSVAGLQLNGNNLTFEHNEISEANADPPYRDTPLGVDFVSTLIEPNIVIRYNKIHDYGACDHFDHGMYLDYISSGEVSGNWIWNGGCSYGMGGGDHTLGCGAGIQLWTAPTGLLIHGNVIDGTGIGFYYSGSTNAISDNVIVNLRGMYTETDTLEVAVAYDGYDGESSNTFDDNDFVDAGSLCTNCTATSANDVSVDPLFNDEANHDYTLRPGSPVASYGLWDGGL